MKKLLVIVLAALPFVMYAQMPGMDFSSMQMDLSEETIVSYTEGMVADYGLNADQAAQVLEINKKYLGKVEYPVITPPEVEEAMKNMGSRQGGAAGFDPGSFSAEDREQMMSRMNEMQDRMNEIADNQEAYEAALASVLDKKQMKKWNKAKKHYQTDQRIKMEAQFGGMGFGDFGGFGGGMPGGGMPGGGFGGGFGF